MTPDPRRVLEIFEEAIARAPEERDAWLTSLCGRDEALRAAVDELLRADLRGASWLDSATVSVTSGPSLARGTMLGAYEIEAVLGSGGMGDVYRALDTRLRRSVAIKVLSPLVAADARALARFTREARAVAALSHPNILAIHDFGIQDGTAYAVTELLEGKTLRETLAAGPLAPRQTVAFAIQIAEGVAAAHDMEVVHRDLKPENIFITTSGLVKILDFGLARITADDRLPAPVETQPGTVMGTTGYMSPEQVRGESTDRTTDIFALGCVMYEMLAGTPPFDRATVAEINAAILRDDPAPLDARVKDVPSGLEAILTHCLEKRPRDRFQSAADLAFALRAAGATVLPAADRAAPVPVAPWRRRGVLVTASVVILAGAAIVARSGRLFGLANRSAATEQFVQLTFDRGSISKARFAANGQDVVFSAAWDGGPSQLYVKLHGNADPVPTGPPNAELLSVSSRGDVAIRQDGISIAVFGQKGRLARMPIVGGAARPVADSVADADWVHDGEGLAVVTDLGGRQRLDCGPGSKTYETPGWITDLRLAPHANTIAFVDHPRREATTGRLVVYDCRSGIRKTLVARRVIQGVAWHPQRNELWFGQYGGVHAVDLDGHERAVLQLPENVRMHDIAADGRVLLSHETVRTRMLLQRLDGGATRDLTWRAWSAPAGFVPDSSKVLFTEGLPQGTAIAAMRGVDGSAVFQLGPGSVFSMSGDGRWAVGIRVNPELRAEMTLTPIGTGEPRPFISRGVENFSWPVFVPRTEEIVFMASTPGHGNRLYRQALSATEPTPISPEGIGMSIGSVSPDGAFAVGTWKEAFPWLFPIRGGDPRSIISTGSHVLAAGWSADSQNIYLRDGSGPEVELRRVNINTGAEQRVAVLRAPDPTGVIWIGPTIVSPDERSVVFSYYRCLSTMYTVTGLFER